MTGGALPIGTVAAASGGHSLGSSFDPTIVRFNPICTLTGFSPMRIVVLPFKYQPSDPVENSLTSAINGMPLMMTSTALASCKNSARVIGQFVLAIGFCLL